MFSKYTYSVWYMKCCVRVSASKLQVLIRRYIYPFFVWRSSYVQCVFINTRPHPDFATKTKAYATCLYSLFRGYSFLGMKLVSLLVFTNVVFPFRSIFFEAFLIPLFLFIGKYREVCGSRKLKIRAAYMFVFVYPFRTFI